MAEFVKLNGYDVKDKTARNQIAALSVDAKIKTTSAILNVNNWIDYGDIYQQIITPTFYYDGSVHTNYTGVLTIAPDYNFDDDEAYTEMARRGVRFYLDDTVPQKTIVVYADTKPQASIPLLITLLLGDENVLITSATPGLQPLISKTTHVLSGLTSPYYINLPDLKKVTISAEIPRESAYKVYRATFNEVYESQGIDFYRMSALFEAPAGTGYIYGEATAEFMGNAVVIRGTYADAQAYRQTKERTDGFYYDAKRRFTKLRISRDGGGTFPTGTKFIVQGE